MKKKRIMRALERPVEASLLLPPRYFTRVLDATAGKRFDNDAEAFLSSSAEQASRMALNHLIIRDNSLRNSVI